jgi:hypothetical protein
MFATSSRSLKRLSSLLRRQSENINQIILLCIHVSATSFNAAEQLTDIVRNAPPDSLKLHFRLVTCSVLSLWIDCFDTELESPADWSVVGHPNAIVSPIFELLDLTQASIEQAVAPGWRALFLRRVVVVGADIVLVCGCEVDRHLVKSSQTKSGIALARQ